MGEELTRSLTVLADRGVPRGAAVVLEAAHRGTVHESASGRATWRRGLAVAFGAAATVLVLIGAVALLHPFGGDGISPVVTQPPQVTQPTGAVTTVADATVPSTIAAVVPEPAGPGNWASFGFDEANSRNNRAETAIGPGNVSDLEIMWRIDDLGGVTVTPIVVDGVVYFGDINGWLHAIDAGTGVAVWEEDITESAIVAAALVTDRLVYVADSGAVLHARDRLTGLAVWTVELDDNIFAGAVAAPVFVDDLVIIGVAQGFEGAPQFRGSVVAVDAGTGAEVWRVYTVDEDSGSGVGVWTAAAVDRDLGLVFFGTGNTIGPLVSPLANALIAIDYEKGELVWHTQLNPDDLRNLDVGASPNLFTIDGRNVVGVGAKTGLFKVVDRETGEEVWSVKLTEGGDPGGVMTTAAVGDGVIYVNSIAVGTGGSITFALDLSDGSIIWEQPLPSLTFGALALANGIVYHGTLDGTIYALDASNGSALWSDELKGGFGDGISIADGTLFVGHGFNYGLTVSQHGGIVAYSLRFHE